jgi:hypothetical protein
VLAIAAAMYEKIIRKIQRSTVAAHMFQFYISPSLRGADVHETHTAMVWLDVDVCSLNSRLLEVPQYLSMIRTPLI